MIDERAQSRTDWVSEQIPGGGHRIEPVSSDASFRSYWRIHTGDGSYILMDAPPAREDCRPFVAIDRMLRSAGLHAPEIHAYDLQQGFVLLEDLGDTLYADMLSPQSADRLYAQAMSAIGRICRIPTDRIPAYDRGPLLQEMGLFPDWYIERQLGLTADREFLGWWEPLTRRLVDNAFEQPQVFVHRDYHCGNLMVCDDPPGVLDFQDAARGPLTYDLVSLLLDRYVTWPRERLLGWAEEFRQAHAPDVDAGTWVRWFDLMGLQRNLKVAGIFARLDLRDGKPHYLQWQPRFLGYVADVAQRYEELEALSRFLNETVAAEAS